jgi:hypothetical protein
MLDESDNFTKHMFHYVPAMPFEVKDSMDITVNGGTEWDHVTLQAGVMQHFWHDFVSDTVPVYDRYLNTQRKTILVAHRHWR